MYIVRINYGDTENSNYVALIIDACSISKCSIK